MRLPRLQASLVLSAPTSSEGRTRTRRPGPPRKRRIPSETHAGALRGRRPGGRSCTSTPRSCAKHNGVGVWLQMKPSPSSRKWKWSRESRWEISSDSLKWYLNKINPHFNVIWLQKQKKKRRKSVCFSEQRISMKFLRVNIRVECGRLLRAGTPCVQFNVGGNNDWHWCHLFVVNNAIGFL